MDKSDGHTIYEFEKFRLDADHLMLYLENEEIPLVPKAVKTLLVLVERRGEIISKEELMDAIWTDAIVEESNLWHYLHQLRKTLGKQANGQPFIETLRRRGYRFNGDVKTSGKPNEEISPKRDNRSLAGLQTRNGGGAIKESITGNVVALADWGGERKKSLSETDSRDVSEKDSAIAVTRHRFSFVALSILGVFILGLAIFAGFRYFSPAPASDVQIESIAVLPFENATGNTDLDYLSDGLSESVIERLSALPQVKVIARASSFKYRGQNADLQDVATKLGARAIVTGRITQRGENIVIRVQMIDTWENRELWSEQFNRSAADALAIEEEIAKTTSEKLRLKLTGTETKRLAKTYTENPEAYQLYLRGRFLYKKYTLADTLKAIEYYDQAIALDPKFALAYVGRANATAMMLSFRDAEMISGSRDAGMPPKYYMKLTREYMLKALEIDDQLAEARTSYAGMLPGFDYDFAGSEREFRRAIELNPNHADAHFWYGQLLSNLGRHEEALAEVRRGEELDPVSLHTNVYKSEILFYARRYDESITEAKKSVELNADYAPAHTRLATAYAMKGDHNASVAETIRFFELRGELDTAEAIRKSFEKGGWEGFVRDATAENPPFKVSRYFVATLYAETGQKDKAFKILDQFYEERSPGLVFIKVDPRLDNLREDPRFADLLRRVGFPQ